MAVNDNSVALLKTTISGTNPATDTVEIVHKAGTKRPYSVDEDGVASDLTIDNSLISDGTAAPATTPVRLGELFVDTNNGTAYIAVGTTSSADWKLIT